MISDIILYLFIVAVAGSLFACFHYCKILKQEMKNLRDEFDQNRKSEEIKEQRKKAFSPLNDPDFYTDGARLKKLYDRVTSLERDIVDVKKHYSTVKADVSLISKRIGRIPQEEVDEIKR